jgi:hypothetical protein
VDRNCAVLHPGSRRNHNEKSECFAFSLIFYKIITGETDVIAVKVKERLERAITVEQSQLGNRLSLPGVTEFMVKLIIKGLEEKTNN